MKFRQLWLNTVAAAMKDFCVMMVYVTSSVNFLKNLIFLTSTAVVVWLFIEIKANMGDIWGQAKCMLKIWAKVDNPEYLGEKYSSATFKTQSNVNGKIHITSHWQATKQTLGHLSPLFPL